MIARGIALIALVSLAACSGGEGGSDKAPTASRCVKVDKATSGAIEKLVEGGALTEAAAVKSKGFENVYMVAGKFGDQIGVWSTNDDPTDATFDGVVQSVDGVAREFSTWPEGDATITADGAAEAKKCLG